ncbi:TetR/AcrR family transcriptional regulator [Streptomyces purpurogeneiscleroticus]|uniref:TetR/AcrR family transcriptional regulator n=1 Tax=Streptomyces purpurogeneiscleroticus TaxID=68259 RepID=UPI001CBB072D|nr:TetR family transcriptional regulator [Streptomyces purpurogeneiscleroticus]MBZ4017824.1 TetR family transcriptional regulator [Streptomyces purpurogeneiscleroticus]
MAPPDRVPTERRRRRPTKSGVVLSAELILDAALELLDAHGAEALTIRRLGTALGADPSAVYRYYRGAEDLLLALGDRLIGEALDGFRPEDHDDWAAALRDFGLRAYRAALRHPRVAVLSSYRVTRRPHEQRAVETGVGLLRRAGFDDATAVRHYHAFVDTVLGHAALDAAVLRLPADQRAGDEQAWSEAYAQLPADAFPHLHAVRDHLPTMAGPAVEHALDLLLSALRAQAPSTV